MSFGFNICISLKQTVLYKQMDQQIRMTRATSPMEQQKKMETSSDETWTRIINFVRKYQSSQLREKQIEQRFTLNHQKLMDIRLKNNEFIIHLYINIQKIWSLGLLKIRDKVRELNNQKKYTFILGFDLSKKQIFIKVVGEKAFINKEILQLLKKNAQQIEEEFFSMGSNLENGDLKSFPILVQYEKWSRQNNTKRCYILGFQKFKIEKTLIKPDEIAEEMKFFSKVFEGLGKNLKQKWKKSSNILQAIRLNQELRTERISGGCNGIVEKLQAVYKISPNFSIHAQTNQQLKKEEQKQNMNMLKQQKQQKSYLIRKTYIQDKFNYFESEINLLKIIRAQKCESINSFYCKPSSLDNLKSPNVFLYSQYHNRTISRQCGIKNCFTIMRTLCEGLVFLSWHGISHRDLKPDNILASKKNVAKIIDFGSACLNSQRKMGQPRLTDSSSVLSTNAKYNLRFSDLPRQLRNQIQIEPFESHCRFDIYAFGKILQNLLLASDNEKELGNQLWECFWYLSSLCQQYDPNDRPTPIQIYAFLKIILKSQCPKKSEEP